MVPELEPLQAFVAARLRELLEKDVDGRIARSGIKPGTLARMKRGVNEASLTNLTMVADAMGVSLDWLVGRRSARDNESNPGALFIESGRQIPDGFLSVPVLKVRASAGPGALAPQDQPGDSVVAFQEEWLRRLGLLPGRAEAMTAMGDSMEPTIRDGDLLLVDRSIDKVVNNGIYVVVYNGAVLLKRVQMHRDGGVTLISDNQIYQPEAVPANDAAELIIEGRVRWFGRMI